MTPNTESPSLVSEIESRLQEVITADVVASVVRLGRQKWVHAVGAKVEYMTGPEAARDYLTKVLSGAALIQLTASAARIEELEAENADQQRKLSEAFDSEVEQEGAKILERKRAERAEAALTASAAQEARLRAALEQINALPSELAGDAWAIARAALQPLVGETGKEHA